MIFSAFGVSEAVTGYMWIGISGPTPAACSMRVIGLFGLGFAHPWLGDRNTALWALIVAASWGAVGLPLMLVLRLGAGDSQNACSKPPTWTAPSRSAIMRHIMMPLSMPGVRVAIFINLLGALRAFDIIYMLTGGGPVRSTETVGYFMYRESMTQFKLGYGAAATVVLLRGRADHLHPRHHPAHGRCQMIGRVPRWTDRGRRHRRLHLDHPDHRHRRHLDPAAGRDDRSAGGGSTHVTLHARVPGSASGTHYPLAQAFWVTAQLAGIATLGTMLLTPAAAYAFHFLKFPFRRVLLIIIINAFVLPQQVVIIPLFQLWRDSG